MKVIIAGTRTHKLEPDDVEKIVSKSGYDITELVCGMATGVDLSAKAWAESKRIPTKKFHPNWVTFGRVAGTERNGRMANYADALIAIWDGSSTGTANMIQQMKNRSKPTTIFRYQ